MAIKLAMSKPYDGIEWRVLEAIIKKIGLGDRWTSLIMECIISMTHSILINGQSRKTIKPAKGIRQGDFIFSDLCASKRSEDTRALQLQEVENQY